MKKLIILLFIALAFNGLSQNFTNQSYVQVIGTSEEEVLPDEIYLQIIINEQDNKGKESVEILETKMVKELKNLKVDIDKDLSIIDLSSNFQKYLLKQNDIFTSKEYQLILHDAQTVGKVFQALENLGISNITIKKVDHSQIKDFEQTARANAIMDARQKAKKMAFTIGQEIGKAIYIHEFENYNPRPFMGMAAGISMKRMPEMDFEDRPNIEFEKIKVESKVEVYFELK